MADIVFHGIYDPPGGIVRLDQPGQRLYSQGGQGIVRGAVYITKDAPGAQIENSIKIELPGGFRAQAGAVQCAAINCGIHCEIDIGGNPLQGVQIIKYGGDIPNGTDISDLYVYNNSQTLLDPNKNHGIYIQDSTNLYGENIRFSNIQGGWAIHFYCNQAVQVCRDAWLRHITCVGNRADVIFWGPGVGGNRVERLYSKNVGAGGVLTQNASAQGMGNILDYVTVSTLDYGYQNIPTPTPVPEPVTTGEVLSLVEELSGNVEALTQAASLMNGQIDELKVRARAQEDFILRFREWIASGGAV